MSKGTEILLGVLPSDICKYKSGVCSETAGIWEKGFSGSKASSWKQC